MDLLSISAIASAIPTLVNTVKGLTSTADNQPAPTQAPVSTSNTQTNALLPSPSAPSTNPFHGWALAALGNLVGDLLRDSQTRSAYNEAYQAYANRLQNNLTSTLQHSPALTTAGFYNPAGDVGQNVPTAYERALTRVRATPEAMLGYSQLIGAAGQLLDSANTAARTAQASTTSQVAGLRRQAAQAARNVGGATALRDVLNNISGNALGAYQSIADTAARIGSTNAAQAGNLLQSAAMIPQQSQAIQYSLWARPREAQLSNTASAMLQRPVPYDRPQPRWGGLTGALYQIGSKWLSNKLIGGAPASPEELLLMKVTQQKE